MIDENVKAPRNSE